MKNLTKSLLAAGVLAISTMSHALPVNTWDATVIGKWTNNFAPNSAVTLSGVGDTLLSWGGNAGSGQSSLGVTNPATTSVNTYFGGGVPPAGFIAPSVSLRHTNNPVFPPSLTSAELTVDVFLTPTDPGGLGFALLPIAYNIRFLETPNTAGTCVVTSPTPCNDIFVLIDGFLNDEFTYAGQKYFVNAFPTSGGVLSTLSDAACAAVGVGNNCFGFTTAEDRFTDLAFGLTISSEPLAVPEPGSLALIGLAMVGMAAVRRRRSTS